MPNPYGAVAMQQPHRRKRERMNKNNKGFSLVELIVVIAIMAILATVAVIGFSAYIQKARNAADTEYISNVVYFAELFATEHQVGIESVHLPKDKVDSVDDIKIWVIDPVTGEPVLKDHTELPWIQDIYDGVGDWEFIGDLEFDDIDGVTGGNTSGGGSNDDENENENEDIVTPDPSCEHTSTYEEIIKPATCQTTGKKAIKCSSCQKTIEQVTIARLSHNYEIMTDVHIDGFTISQCSMCKEKQIKNENNLPLVPVG